jgi:hypothetical protein
MYEPQLHKYTISILFPCIPGRNELMGSTGAKPATNHIDDPPPTIPIVLEIRAVDSYGDFDVPISYDLNPDGETLVFCACDRMTDPLATLERDRIKLNCPTVSLKSHAQLYCENGEVYVQDTGSCRGTWLNDYRLVEVPFSISVPFRVCDGDLLRIGDSLMHTVR